MQQDTKQDTIIRVTVLANALLILIGAIARTSGTGIGSTILMLVFFAWIAVTMWYAGALKLATQEAD